jgi:hypothetical protein
MIPMGKEKPSGKKTSLPAAPKIINSADVAVFVACELTAIPLCNAGWDAIVSGDHSVRGVVALGTGLIFGLLGPSYRWLKDKISTSARDWIQERASRWWLVTFVMAFAYLVGPSVYKRATASSDNAQVGNVIWNFEQTARGLGYFLTLQRVNGQEIRFINFGAHGKNISNSPIYQFSGYLQSDLTNARLQIYLLAQNAEAATTLACFAHPWIPTLPEETFSIPPLADFEITTFDKAFIEAGKDGMPISIFWNNFGPFMLVLEYDGVRFQRHFSKEEIQRQLDMFEKSLNPKSNPFVLRRPNASPAALPPLEPLVINTPSLPPPLSIPKAPAPPLASPVPPGAFKLLDSDLTGTVPLRN